MLLAAVTMGLVWFGLVAFLGVSILDHVREAGHSSDPRVLNAVQNDIAARKLEMVVFTGLCGFVAVLLPLVGGFVA